MKRKIHNFSMLTAFTSSALCARSAQSRLAPPGSESQPSSSDAKTQLTDFSQIPKILRARFRCMTSLTHPSHIPHPGFLF